MEIIVRTWFWMVTESFCFCPFWMCPIWACPLAKVPSGLRLQGMDGDSPAVDTAGTVADGVGTPAVDGEMGDLVCFFAIVGCCFSCWLLLVEGLLGVGAVVEEVGGEGDAYGGEAVGVVGEEGVAWAVGADGGDGVVMLVCYCCVVCEATMYGCLWLVVLCCYRRWSLLSLTL